MHRENRTQPIEKGVVHVNVGPETEGGAKGLAAYLEHQDGGYHNVIDDKLAVITAADNQLVWGASYMNARGKHYCLIGEADQTAEQWLDAYSRGELNILAQMLALDCRKYGWAPRRLTVQEVATSGARGLCGHVDVTNAYKAQGKRDGVVLDHWDPGPNFPWASLLADVQTIMSGGVAVPTSPTGEEEEMKPTDEVKAVMSPTPGLGRYILTRDGGVKTFAPSAFFGSIPGLAPKVHPLIMGVNHAIDILVTPTGNGYWILDASGAVYSFGDGAWHNNFNKDLTPTLRPLNLAPWGNGYRAIRSDGAVMYPR